MRAILACLLAASPAGAQSESEELAKQLSNPVASLISVPFQSNFDFGAGREDDGFRYLLNFQPVIPISLGERWNLISRTIVPLIHQDDVFDDGTQQFGLGDVVQSFFLSPKQPGPFGLIWGVGPVLLLDTATRDVLGTDHWGAGPTFVVLRQDGGWTYGMLANHIWGFSGDEDRADVDATFLQPFVSYTWRTGTTLGINTESTYDWEANTWTLPVNVFASQVLKLGSQRLSFTLGARHYVETPAGGPDWGLRFAVTLLFPR